MKKILFSLMAVICTAAFADSNEYATFQQFDNHVSFGMDIGQGSLSAKNTNNGANTYNYNSVNLEVEKLFDAGIWLNAKIGNLNTYEQSGMPLTPLGSYQFVATANAKIGYNFPIIQDTLSITPYVLIGKNANTAQLNSVNNGMGNGVGITQDFYLTNGIGFRLDYPINKNLDIYFDQYGAYNADQAPISSAVNDAGTTFNNVSTSNLQYTTTLGLRANLWEDLQLGASVFYNAYTNYSNDAMGLYNGTQGYGLPTNNYGAEVQVGWTFK